MDNNEIENEIETEEFIPETENEETVYRKPLNILKKRRATIVLIIALSLVAAAGLTFLAFKIFTPNIAPMNETFYFTSDLLENEPGKEFAAYKSIDFTLCNYADELRTSKKNVDNLSFKVTYGQEDITSKCKIECPSYEMSAKERISNFVSITVPDEYYGLPVNVSVESLPISYTLYGTFYVYGDWGYDIADNLNEYVCKMTLWSNSDIDLKISWDPQLVTPDYTNLLIFEYSMDDMLGIVGNSITSRLQTAETTSGTGDETAEPDEDENEGEEDDEESAAAESEEIVLKGADNIVSENGLATKTIRLPAGTSTVIPMFKSVSSDNYLRGDNKAKISVEPAPADQINATEVKGASNNGGSGNPDAVSDKTKSNDTSDNTVKAGKSDNSSNKGSSDNTDNGSNSNNTKKENNDD